MTKIRRSTPSNIRVISKATSLVEVLPQDQNLNSEKLGVPKIEIKIEYSSNPIRNFRMLGADQEILGNIYTKYGYDFRDYSPELIRRRIRHCMVRENISDLKTFNDRLLSEKGIFARLVNDFSINVSEMFRDPHVWKTLREEVMPRLATYPRIRIWSAGTASGQEAYSLAIMLHELGLYDRSIIYATDLNPMSLHKAQTGQYALDKVARYTVNYHRSGGQEDFSQYYSTKPHYAQFDPELKKNIVFSTHSLEADGVFNEFQLILCRNVLIYFQNGLISKVLKLFTDSLSAQGTLCLGAHESMYPHEEKRYFSQEHPQHKIYRKVF